MGNKSTCSWDMFKVHLTPQFFFSAKSNLLNIWSIKAKKILHLLESSIFYALSKSRETDDGEDLFADELFVCKEWIARYEVEE